MASRDVQRLTLAAVLIGGMGLGIAQTATALPRPGVPRSRPVAARGFNLFAGAADVMMNTNRVVCNITNLGEHCVASPLMSWVAGGGLWPKGTPDQYIYNGGLQVAAIIPGNRQTFAWSGDTVGAYFFDARGDQRAGQGLTGVYSSLNATDLAEWPAAAYVNDPTLFNAALLGRKTISQQDAWVRYWDGDVNRIVWRGHPMGLLVDQRALMWDFPSGNQDILYFLIRFINVTANDATRYASLSAYGYSASDIADIVQIARNFRAASEAKFNVQIPDTGYVFAHMYAGYGQDPDLGNPGANYSTTSLPFEMGFVYSANMSEPTWSYPADIFGAPFAAAPGFEGVKYLKSPTNPATGRPFGITMFTNTTNGGAFPDRVGPAALWRLASNNLRAQDGSCNAPAGTPYCYLAQAYADTRFYVYSGPMTIKPGESAVVVVAIVHAAPVASAIVTDGAGNPLGSAAYDMKPGFPGTSTGYLSGTRKGQSGPAGVLDTVRRIDRAVGWVSATPAVSAALDLNANGLLEQNEIPTIPRSLLHKSLVAQAVYDASFLLPFAPEGPSFFLVAGDNQVTVVWQTSSTESVGDPYFAIASDPLKTLYDPNFRRYDVEGYRIWKGRTEATMEVVASFDYAGSTMTDRTGQFWSSDVYGNRCAPELGILTSCPVAFLPNGSGPTHAVDLVGDIIQVPPGGRVQLASGDILIVSADTAVVGGNSGLPALTDNGVPFAYVDRDVRNGFRYFYAVTAFDINSVAAGPSSLESPLATKQAMPRAVSTTVRSAVLVQGMFGGDGTQLDPSAAFPTLDSATGTFNGLMPPANAGSLGFLASVVEALPEGDYAVRVDSLSPGLAPTYGAATRTLYVTFIAGTERIPRSYTVTVPAYGDTLPLTFSASLPLVPYDSARARLLHLAFTQDVRMPVEFSDGLWRVMETSLGAALVNGRFGTKYSSRGSRFFMKSYWYDETAATQPPDPTINPYGSAAHSNGQLTGVSIIYSPNVYRQATAGGAAARSVNVNTRGYFANSTAQYPADFVVTWGAGGTITVRDSTHRVNLPFKKSAQTGYGFLSAAAIVAAGTTAGDLSDGNAGTTFDPSVISYYSLYTVNTTCDEWWGITCVDLAQTATLQPIDYTTDGISDGNGIALIINGEPFYFLMSALPAAGTKWHLKVPGGGTMNATCTPAVPASGDLLLAAVPTDCSGYTFTALPYTIRPAVAPGLTYLLRVTQGFATDSSLADLSLIHTVPDPYYVTNPLERTTSTKVLRFVNLPDRAIIRIYSVSGVLVNVLTHNDPAGGGEEIWNLRNRNNQYVASGVYFYHVETPDGRTKIGRFTVVNYAE